MFRDKISRELWTNLTRKENGTSLVETLVAAAISVIIFGVITTIMVQFLLVTRWGNSQLEISNDIQVVSIWLGRDALEASSFTPGSGNVYGTLIGLIPQINTAIPMTPWNKLLFGNTSRMACS